MRFIFKLLAMLVAAFCAASPVLAKPPMEAFGNFPQIRQMQMSPDGKRLAYLQRIDGQDVLRIHDLETGTSRMLARVSDLRARYVQFAGNDHVVIVVTKDEKIRAMWQRFEFSAAYAFDIATGTSKRLLSGTPNLHPLQAGLGQIKGIDPNGQYLLMPAFITEVGASADYDLLRVPLDTGRGGRMDGGRGVSTTVDWFANTKGQIIVREDYDNKSLTHQVKARQSNGDWKTVYEKQTDKPEFNLVGTSADGLSVFMIDSGESEFLSLHRMSLVDGAIEDTVMKRDDAEVTGVITDINNVVYGVAYSGMFPSYDMFDDKLDADIQAVMETMPGSAVHLASWSQDWSKLLFMADGGEQVSRYLTFDRNTRALTLIANARPEITPADVGEVITIAYKARDGLTIPALVTWPAGVAPENRKSLPLVVMPHGGPEAYDSVGFDWIAQFLANEGYAVLQPNFRGSAGFGKSFVEAGYREWGRKMQDDITDGANALKRMGWVDPSRMCIVGWSYGGYAALAGGAITPDLYKCVVAVAGVSHLRDMLAWEKRRYGPKSGTVEYWKRLIGDPDKEPEVIDSVSPALLAEKFSAPVLLIHGESDTVVPVIQSRTMNDALVRAKKPVQFISIPGDDHSLVEDESRRQVLTAMGDFLRQHIGE